MGHAIRLFEMPQHFARFLDVLETAASRDVVLARHFGGRVQREPALDRWARIVADVEQALSAGKSKLVMVTTPEPFSLNEAARSASAFQRGGQSAADRRDRPESRGGSERLSAMPSPDYAGPRGPQIFADTFSQRQRF